MKKKHPLETHLKFSEKHYLHTEYLIFIYFKTKNDEKEMPKTFILIVTQWNSTGSIQGYENRFVNGCGGLHVDSSRTQERPVNSKYGHTKN